MFESMEMDWLCLESALINFENENDLYNLDLNEGEYFEAVNEGVVGAVAMATLTTSAAVGISQLYEKGKAKKTQKKHIEFAEKYGPLNDNQLKEFHKAISISHKIIKESIKRWTELNPFMSKETAEKLSKDQWTLITNYNDKQIRVNRICPVLRYYNGKPINSYDSTINKLNILCTNLNEAFKKEGLPCVATYTEYDGSTIGIQYRGVKSTAKESLMFGEGLFEETIALEYICDSEPAIEGAGTAIWNTIVGIFNAVKKFFVALLEKLTHVAFFTEDKKIRMTISGANQIIAECNKFLTIMTKATNILIESVNTTANASSRMCSILNGVFAGSDVSTIRCDQRFLDNAEDIAHKCKRGVKNSEESMNEVKTAFKNTREKCLSYVDSKSREDPSRVYKVVKDCIMGGFTKSASLSIKQLQQTIRTVKSICSENIDFCEKMVSKCKKASTPSNGNDTKAGYQLCKYYMDISHSYQNFSRMAIELKDGTCLSIN